MGFLGRLLGVLGKRISGIILFTFIYLLSIYSFNRFLNIHPEARHAILTLLSLTSIVYVLGLIVIVKYYK